MCQMVKGQVEASGRDPCSVCRKGVCRISIRGVSQLG